MSVNTSYGLCKVKIDKFPNVNADSRVKMSINGVRNSMASPVTVQRHAPDAEIPGIRPIGRGVKVTIDGGIQSGMSEFPVMPIVEKPQIRKPIRTKVVIGPLDENGDPIEVQVKAATDTAPEEPTPLLNNQGIGE